MKKKILLSLTAIFLLGVFVYVSAVYYVAYSILKIDHTCGLHQNSKPNTWDTALDANEYKNAPSSKIEVNDINIFFLIQFGLLSFHIIYLRFSQILLINYLSDISKQLGFQQAKLLNTDYHKAYLLN